MAPTESGLSCSGVYKLVTYATPPQKKKKQQIEECLMNYTCHTRRGEIFHYYQLKIKLKKGNTLPAC